MEYYKKKYEEAMLRMNKWVEGSEIVVYPKEVAEFVFPELKEREDEMVRQHLLKHFRAKTKEEWNGMPIKNIIAWLEKQDPKKHEEELEKAYKTADEVQYKKGFEDAKREFEKQGEQKPAWSEEDEKMWITISDLLWEGFKLSDKKVSWDKIRCWLLPKITYFKDRVQTHPKQEWSGNDENGLGDALWAVQQARSIAKDENEMGGLWYAEKWLKSLKERLQPQNTWKPSDEQMHYLSWIANIKLGDSVVEQEVSKHLNELLEDLKKQSGE